MRICFIIKLSIGPISDSSIIQWANEVEHQVRVTPREENQRNIFWLNPNGNNGHIYSFFENGDNTLQKRSSHFFSKAGIPWLGHPSTVIVNIGNPTEMVTLSCYLQTNGFPVNITLLWENTVYPFR